MVEFDYKLDYKNTLFRPNDRRYRIGRGEQGVLLVRPYTDVICRKFLEMGFTRARRYANHKDGKKYGKDGKILPQEKDWATSEKAKSARRFKDFRDLVTQDEFYISMRKEWRDKEQQ